MGIRLALVATALVLSVIVGCGDEGSEDGGEEYCAYTVEFLNICDISYEHQAPRQSNCVEFLAACNYEGTCESVGVVSRCTKPCSGSMLDRCAPGVCDESIGFCVPR